MRAVRVVDRRGTLDLAELPRPEPTGTAVRVRVVAAGVCHSDLHLLDGLFADQVSPPVTLGHEIVGVVDAVGSAAGDLREGTPVVVMVGWGCGHCRWCVGGHEQLCPDGREAGATADGGFAEYVLVPHRRHLVPLDGVDPLAAVTFGCAALCAYAAVSRVQPWLVGASTLAVIGAGGLGLHAIHYARLLTGARVIAVDRRPASLDAALRAGAHGRMPAGEDAASAILELTGREGCRAVIDMVGSDESLRLGASVVGRRGVLALLGLAGGRLSVGFDTLAPEATVTTVVAGTVADLQEVVHLSRRAPVPVPVVTYPLSEAAAALDDLRAGRVHGRAVLLPDA